MKVPRHSISLLFGVLLGALPWIFVSVSMFGGQPTDWIWIVVVGAIPAALNGLFWYVTVPRYMPLEVSPRAAIVAGPIVGFIGTILVSSFLQLPQVGKEAFQRFAVAGVVQTGLNVIGGATMLVMANSLRNLRRRRP